MNAAKKLKILMAVFFCFIVILVIMLVYAVSHKAGVNSAASGTTSVAAATVSQASNTSPAKSSQTAQVTNKKETMELKLYYYDADDYDKPKEIKNIAIDKKLYEDDKTSALNTLLSTTVIKINKAVLNGKDMTIDLPKETVKRFNSGSAAGITYTNILAMTVLNLPGVEQMNVTMDGQTGIESDHFSFNGTFKKSEDGKKYVFNQSDKPGNAMDIK
ncbi:MAG TPA: GerMN domain-containing protein [Ruminiclostridium sp.]|nr:GerMN domain-containing protein [Ruminiclostridium sp.]